MIQTRTLTTTIIALLMASASVSAQTIPARFHWQTGQVLTYRVEHTMTSTDTVDGTKAETVNKLSETKRWQVLAVDPTGTATIQLTVPVLRFETTTHKGDVLLFDSANLDKSTPELREQLQTNKRSVGTKEAEIRRLMRRTEKQRKCIRRKKKKDGTPGENLIDRVFEQRLAQLQKQIDEIVERQRDKKRLRVAAGIKHAPMNAFGRPHFFQIFQIATDRRLGHAELFHQLRQGRKTIVFHEFQKPIPAFLYKHGKSPRI